MGLSVVQISKYFIYNKFLFCSFWKILVIYESEIMKAADGVAGTYSYHLYLIVGKQLYKIGISI